MSVLACSSPQESAPVAPPVVVANLEVTIPNGQPLVVRGDTKIQADDYLRPPRVMDGTSGVIFLDGLDGATLDLTGSTLRGTPAGTDLDKNTGYGIVVRNCRNVTIRGGTLGGYRGCIVVEDSQDVVVEGVLFDGWFGQRLLSNVAAENLSDWLRPHDNDRGEWLAKYGGAISVTDCERVTVRDCRGRHGQNGILLTRTVDSEVYDNDFSFLSGWGLGMYRSSRNVVSHNIFDYCVRGYSHDVYWRGQDSAGILMFERCSDNVFAMNSATHGGDGVFLFAGFDIVEGRARARGELDADGCDRNLWYRNDLRFAVANSLEATFSSHNVAIGNRLSGSHQHGVWGGYSSNMVLFGNEIDDTIGGGITIEHGQDCLIAHNTLANNIKGIELYWDPDPQFVDGPFGEHHDTASSGHWIVGNTFEDNDLDLSFVETTSLAMSGNTFSGRNRSLEISGVTDGDTVLAPEAVRARLKGADGSLPSAHVQTSSFALPQGAHPRYEDMLRFAAPEVPGTRDTALETRGETGGLETIVMGEWGPWDFRSGDPRPPERLPGGVLAHARWQATWFAWDKETEDPRGDVDAWRALRFEPVVRKEVGNWRSPWSDDEVRQKVGGAHFGLIAMTRARIDEAGRYRLTVVSDDGVRVLVDGDVLLEDWTWHAPKTDTVEVDLTSGIHSFTVEYFQIDGAAALSIDLERVN